MPSQTVVVLLGVRNAERTLQRTLESIETQTYPHILIVAVDDASTDQTPTILHQQQKKLGKEKLQIITNQKNLGLTRSLNAGLQAITAPYVARIDADDWWASTKLAKQVAYLEAHPECGVVGCNYANVSANGHIQSVQVPTTDGEIRSTIVRRNPFAHSCVVFRTKLVQDLGGYDPAVRYGQDYDLWFRIMGRAKLANVPEELCFRQIGSGISVDKQRAQMVQSLRTQAKYIRQYQLPLGSYLNMLEPLVVILTPEWVKKIKRNLVR